MREMKQKILTSNNTTDWSVYVRLLASDDATWMKYLHVSIHMTRLPLNTLHCNNGTNRLNLGSIKWTTTVRPLEGFLFIDRTEND